MDSVLPSRRMERKAEAVLNRLVAENVLSHEGRQWLMGCLDPFHDSELALFGHPDITSSRSVVQCLQRTTMVSSSSPSWSLAAFMNPHVEVALGLAEEKLYPVVVSPDGTVIGTTGPTVCPGLNLIEYTGAMWDSTGAVPHDGCAFTAGLTSDTYNRGRKSRLVGMAYEIVDVTPELYKGGTCTAYRQPMSHTPSTLRFSTGHSQLSKLSGVPMLSDKAAALYPNSRIWPAKEGIYAVCTLNDVENPAQAKSLGYSGLCDTDFGLGNKGWLTMEPSTGNPMSSRTAPFDNTGCFFTGLNAETRLQVTVRYIVETFPTAGTLLPLVRPPSPYDPLALELYARCSKELPGYCMVKDNPLGEWFSKILSTIGHWAPVIGKAIPHPVAGLIGSALGSAANAAHALLPASPNAAKATAAAKKKPPPVPPKPKRK